jgi:hypothetical protein
LVSRDIDTNGTFDAGLVAAVDAFVKLWFNCWKYSAVRRLDKTSVVPLFLYRADFKQQIVYPPPPTEISWKPYNCRYAVLNRKNRLTHFLDTLRGTLVELSQK